MRGRVIRKFWGIVPITAQDAKTIYEADKDSLLYFTDGSRAVIPLGITMTVSAEGPIFCL